MAKKKEDFEKEYIAGNVIFARHNVFYDQIFLIHADIIRDGSKIDERNIGSYVDFLSAFVAGYVDYIKESEEIKSELKEIKDALISKEYLKFVIKIFRNGILGLTDDEFFKYKSKMAEIKQNIFDVFEHICKNLPDKNVFPQETNEAKEYDDKWS